jgi:hypothetical protein
MHASTKSIRVLVALVMPFGLAPAALAGPGPPAEGRCRCVLTNVQPAGNLVTLNKTETGGKGSSKTVNVTVNVHAESTTPGACTSEDSSEPVTLSLVVVDDDGGMILNESKVGYRCFGTGSNSVKFPAQYTVANCADSVPPQGGAVTSTGSISIRAAITGDHGPPLLEEREIKCKAN